MCYNGYQLPFEPCEFCLPFCWFGCFFLLLPFLHHITMSLCICYSLLLDHCFLLYVLLAPSQRSAQLNVIQWLWSIQCFVQFHCKYRNWEKHFETHGNLTLLCQYDIATWSMDVSLWIGNVFVWLLLNWSGMLCIVCSCMWATYWLERVTNGRKIERKKNHWPFYVIWKAQLQVLAIQSNVHFKLFLHDLSLVSQGLENKLI